MGFRKDSNVNGRRILFSLRGGGLCWQKSSLTDHFLPPVCEIGMLILDLDKERAKCSVRHVLGYNYARHAPLQKRGNRKPGSNEPREYGRPRS